MHRGALLTCRVAACRRRERPDEKLQPLIMHFFIRPKSSAVMLLRTWLNDAVFFQVSQQVCTAQ